MAVSKDFAAYVLEQLSALPRVTSRRMFGGVGVYADGLFFALIADDTLYFKVDDSNRADYLRLGSKPFVPYADRPEVSMSYYTVPAEVLDEVDELTRWARKSIAVALAAASRKTKPKVPSETRGKPDKGKAGKGKTVQSHAKKRSTVKKAVRR
jgi:DNA transformation protein and related proteins